MKQLKKTAMPGLIALIVLCSILATWALAKQPQNSTTDENVQNQGFINTPRPPQESKPAITPPAAKTETPSQEPTPAANTPPQVVIIQQPPAQLPPQPELPPRPPLLTADEAAAIIAGNRPPITETYTTPELTEQQVWNREQKLFIQEHEAVNRQYEADKRQHGTEQRQYNTAFSQRQRDIASCLAAARVEARRVAAELGHHGASSLIESITSQAPIRCNANFPEPYLPDEPSLPAILKCARWDSCPDYIPT